MAIFDSINGNTLPSSYGTEFDQSEPRCCADIDTTSPPVHEQIDQFDDITRAFVRLTSLSTYPLDRLNRYEAALWRQARQILTVLHRLDRRRPWERAISRSIG
jgi:hypothetical protein